MANSTGALQLGTGRNLSWPPGIRRDMVLLEVDEELLDELLHSGLCLKGAEGEEAVLCSSSKTYAVKTVETTNLVLLVPGDDAADAAAATPPPPPQPTPPGQLVGLATQVQKNAAAAGRAPLVAAAVVSNHLELVPAAPRLHLLDQLLQERQYRADRGGEGCGDTMDTDQQQQQASSSSSGGGGGGAAGGHTEAELLAVVQCSAAELTAALRDRKPLCLNGRYCQVDAAYQGLLLELVLLTAVEHGWPLGALPGDAMAAALEPHGYDRRVTLHCLVSFGSEQQQVDGAGDASTSGSGGGVYALEEAAVCLHFARKLLLEQGEWDLGAFQAAWKAAVPEGMSPHMDMLRGEVLVSSSTSGVAAGSGTAASSGWAPPPPRVKHFPLARLPRDASARFAALFAERTRWQWEELEPYVRGLQGPGLNAEALLLRHTRLSQQRPSDPVTYSAR